MTDEIEIEVAVTIMKTMFSAIKEKGQMCPAEVIVLYVEVLFACSTLIIKCNDVFLGRCPVVGEDTAVCVYYSEHICLPPAILVFQRTTLYDKPI